MAEVCNLVVLDYLQADTLILDSSWGKNQQADRNIYCENLPACRQVSILVRQLDFRDWNTLHNSTSSTSIFKILHHRFSYVQIDYPTFSITFCSISLKKFLIRRTETQLRMLEILSAYLNCMHRALFLVSTM